jgi:hypothetical protein
MTSRLKSLRSPPAEKPPNLADSRFHRFFAAAVALAPELI